MGRCRNYASGFARMTLSDHDDGAMPGVDEPALARFVNPVTRLRRRVSTRCLAGSFRVDTQTPSLLGKQAPVLTLNEGINAFGDRVNTRGVNACFPKCRATFPALRSLAVAGGGWRKKGHKRGWLSRSLRSLLRSAQPTALRSGSPLRSDPPSPLVALLLGALTAPAPLRSTGLPSTAPRGLFRVPHCASWTDACVTAQTAVCAIERQGMTCSTSKPPQGSPRLPAPPAAGDHAPGRVRHVPRDLHHVYSTFDTKM